MNREEKRGAAPTLAIFLLLVLVGTGLVLTHLRSMRRKKTEEIRRLTISDTTQNINATIQAELNEALHKSATGAMYRTGIAGGSRENVERYVIEYLNRRIDKGWDYPFVDIEIPKVSENFLKFGWQPDGSLTIWGYVNNEVRHVKGPSAFGIYLHASPKPRFRRIKHVAGVVVERAQGTDPSKFENLEKSLNENFSCEGIKIDLKRDNEGLFILVTDIFGGKNAIVG